MSWVVCFKNILFTILSLYTHIISFDKYYFKNILINLIECNKLIRKSYQVERLWLMYKECIVTQIKEVDVDIVKT